MPLLSVEQLDKVFGQHYALKDVSIEIEAGEVHALVGENGAGKSTFIKLITGVYQPTAGHIYWGGREVQIGNPSEARRLGINVIHQERHLVPSFSGMENLFVGLPYPRGKWWPGIRWNEMKLRAEQLKKELGIDIPLHLPASEMSPPQRTLLEILRAMLLECKLLFLDEPTASLTDQEAEILFELIGRLKSQGTAIIYVSHRLDEVFRLSDRITVLKNGKKSGILTREEANRERLIQLMTEESGITFAAPIQRYDASQEPIVLEVKDLATADGKVKNASLSVRQREIVGVFGLAGAGRTELLEAIYGLRPLSRGKVAVSEQQVDTPSPADSLQRGVVLIPEDRRGSGLVMSLTIRENMTLPILSRYTNGGVIEGKAEHADVKEKMSALNVKATGSEQRVGQLSGGNQQKVVFAKALMSNPCLFLCDEPTQAVDIMTRNEIHRLLREQTEQGNGVLFVSSDLPEVLEVAGRLVVMHDGETIAELPVEGLKAEDVLQLCYRQRKEGATSHESN
ncbi:sugar ABC transporter ATP-binding protein [Brevibacillus humidisoli]|uniref:sugar ABC transporter ATP-binding protein n=1 Tax=Brevibacillus humidisoli TaxID=2895522 RepID=UPI001E56FE80|nr:sugar ABC transporter ATP-binding protein [Brevibacillus humidisoli]UFJ39794.1 sugar ABC transporter ATP-binding protein [Brevibacillus humidisoli]